MSNHIGLLLSLVIFAQIFLICLDLVRIQTLNSKLVTESNYVNALIQKNREINEEVFDAYKQDDEVAKIIVDRFAGYLGSYEDGK